MGAQKPRVQASSQVTDKVMIGWRGKKSRSSNFDPSIIRREPIHPQVTLPQHHIQHFSNGVHRHFELPDHGDPLFDE
jgi:hypothetical protein